MLQETLDLFPFNVIHIGGDEVRLGWGAAALDTPGHRVLGQVAAKTRNMHHAGHDSARCASGQRSKGLRQLQCTFTALHWGPMNTTTGQS